MVMGYLSEHRVSAIFSIIYIVIVYGGCYLLGHPTILFSQGAVYSCDGGLVIFITILLTVYFFKSFFYSFSVNKVLAIAQLVTYIYLIINVVVYVIHFM